MKKKYLLFAAVMCLLTACGNNSDNAETTPAITLETEMTELTDSTLSETVTENTTDVTELTTEETTVGETSAAEETSEITSEETIAAETTTSVISETVTTAETASAAVTEAVSETKAPIITSAAETTTSQVTTETNPPVDEQKPKILVAYFSTPEITDASTTASRVTVDGQTYGTTEYMAMVIHENTNSDLFRIELEEPYGGDVPDRALNEQENGILPALSSHIENLEQYDTVFVGYPTWWYDMPQVMYSFFDEYDLSGKKIIPFNSHGGSQFSGSVERIAELEPNANVSTDGLTISRGNVDSSEETIIQWLDGLGILKD